MEVDPVLNQEYVETYPCLHFRSTPSCPWPPFSSPSCGGWWITMVRLECMQLSLWPKTKRLNLFPLEWSNWFVYRKSLIFISVLLFWVVWCNFSVYSFISKILICYLSITDKIGCMLIRNNYNNMFLQQKKIWLRENFVPVQYAIHWHVSVIVEEF